MNIFDWLGTSKQTQTSKSGVNVASETALEQSATKGLGQNMDALQGLVVAGANQGDVAAGAQGNRDLASLLQQYSSPQGLMQAQQGAMQGYTDIGNQLFGGVLRQQNQQAMRQAALSGRQGNDSILQAKLGQQRMDTVGQFAAQQSMNAPMQSAQFAQQRASVLDQLSQNAFANRQMVLGFGSQLREQDRAYRINTGERFNNTSQTQTASPLNIIGGIAGLAGGAMGAMGGLKSLFGGAGGAAAGAGAGGGQSFLGGNGMASQLGGGQFSAPQASSYFSGANPFSGGSAPAMQQFAMKPAAYPDNNFVMQNSQGPAPQMPGQWKW